MKTRIITAIVGILVLIGVMFTFNTMVFNLVIAAITLIAIHEIYSALGFEKKDWLMYAVLVPYTLLVMLSSYSAMRRLVMPVSFVLVTFFAIYLVVRNGTISYQKASGLLVFSGIVIFCFYSFILLKERLPVEKFGYDAVFFILLILCFAWGGDTCAYFAGRAFGKHKLCPVVSPKKTVEGAIGGVLGTMVFGVVATLIYSMAANRMEAFTRSNIGVSMYVIIALLGCIAAVRHQGLRHHLSRSRRHSGPFRQRDVHCTLCDHGNHRRVLRLIQRRKLSCLKKLRCWVLPAPSVPRVWMSSAPKGTRCTAFLPTAMWKRSCSRSRSSTRNTSA